MSNLRNSPVALSILGVKGHHIPTHLHNMLTCEAAVEEKANENSMTGNEGKIIHITNNHSLRFPSNKQQIIAYSQTSLRWVVMSYVFRCTL